MPLATYRSLIDEVCTLSLIPLSPDFHENANFMIDHVDFTLQHRIHQQIQQVAIYADMGPLSSGDCSATLLSLLEINFFIFHSGQAPVFSYNPETQHVLLMGTADLANTSAPTLLLMMKAFAQLANEWRKTAFQEKQPRSSSTPGATAPRTSTSLSESQLRARRFQ